MIFSLAHDGRDGGASRCRLEVFRHTDAIVTHLGAHLWIGRHAQLGRVLSRRVTILRMHHHLHLRSEWLAHFAHVRPRRQPKLAFIQGAEYFTRAFREAEIGVTVSDEGLLERILPAEVFSAHTVISLLHDSL